MRPRLVVVTVVLALAAAITAACAGSGGSEQTITFRYTRFVQDHLTVKAGEPVTFVLQNNDPIMHEWIVGNDEIHAGHRTGTEPYHDRVPTEVTVQALTTKRTTVTFDTPGVYRFICHLPGHEEYGMKGTLTVLPD